MQHNLDLDAVQVIAWDFDGVLNRNIEKGVFAWSRNFEQDLGLPLQSFSSFLFSGRFQKAMVGQACLVELVTEWAELNDAPGRAPEILDYWFRQDAIPDDRTLALFEPLKARGLRHVMATNNEIHRTAFIEDAMGFGGRMERIFAAGRMGIAKPDTAYFAHIETELGVAPEALLLVDDMEENVASARTRGWQAFHFEEGAHELLERALGLQL
ncbi:HAD-superfamily hydrolase, subfamily IA, variant 3 [Hyphomonas neptunium ATCC 15444]|uniref:HAD-superfamily hydrolase, subfamily IA, variant 3 n=2 Tax=Hyphomonas TaxID=85 RepID=Q0C5S0_HYPNA|nr:MULTISPECIES: HAD-IA family hydrolase [Hyphomonas]ABI76302.1 HAD-superfamily hydrolase, subfamily IA, variant 3 [Hyphomonas neptunium ATCC 15444]KCZ89326.1 HAD family hydrolase [Hyphomonas hirschiana VP5]